MKLFFSLFVSFKPVLFNYFSQITFYSPFTSLLIKAKVNMIQKPFRHIFNWNKYRNLFLKYILFWSSFFFRWSHEKSKKQKQLFCVFRKTDNKTDQWKIKQNRKLTLNLFNFLWVSSNHFLIAFSKWLKFLEFDI